nr:hypothetical protein [uncultured bacterium]
MTTEVDVAIVGGGAAGIGAARALVQGNPGLRVLLLEASSRLGGRACTREYRGLDLDLGAGWLHSADRNAWTNIATAAGIPIDRTPPAWGQQFRDAGFPKGEQVAARRAVDEWVKRLRESPPADDCTASALDPANEWNAYIRTIAGFLTGAPVERLSAADYVAYDEVSTDANWRVKSGYGALVAQGFPAGVTPRLGTPVTKIDLAPGHVALETPAGAIRARAAILSVSTGVLAGDTIELPRQLDAWREAASHLPLGHTEKFFLEIVGNTPFEADKQALGNPRDVRTASYYLMPFGWQVVECFLSGEAADLLEQEGPGAAFDFAFGQLAALFGADIRRSLRPLAASHWNRTVRIGGAYSYALPGKADARAALAAPCDDRIFFAGEATSREDYSTVHGAHDGGVRAAGEVLRALAVEPNLARRAL